MITDAQRVATAQAVVVITAIHRLGGTATAVAHKTTASAASSPAKLAQAVKELVAQYGTEAIKDMVDVFAK